MARRSITGVGRGNASGSRKGQFGSGAEWRGNKAGRPTKAEQRARIEAERPISEISANLLRKKVKVGDNGVTRNIPMIQAMMQLTISDFGSASYSEKLKALAFFTSQMNQQNVTEMTHNHLPPEEVVAEILEELLAEVEEQHRYDDQR